ncbi:intraflagellar transport protein 81 [Novymonas esmeraldas]|uniref:Intraflagellar transport protein 81 homolog n=1 Tax=Novymonas esmeraldas TaxID=1808958 RepID=A0AAW0ER42_9TRYP
MSVSSPPPSVGHTGPAAAAPPEDASQLSAEDLLQQIVELVNTVLERHYSLVEFDALGRTELLQVVNDIFAKLQPSMKIDMQATSPDEAMPRMLDFLLKILGYRVPVFFQGSFPQSFADGEPLVVYPTMYWILTHMELNEKRVYLARFLQPLDIPEDIRAQDEDVRTLFMQYQALRGAFIQTHQRVDKLRSAFADPVEARRKVGALEDERDRLQGYVDVARRKLAGVPEKEMLLAASKSLRMAREESAKLAEREVEQQQAKVSSEARRTEISTRLQNLRRDAADGRAEMMIRRMKDEMDTNRMKLHDQLPQELESMKNENAELQRLVSEPLDMASLTATDRKLDDELKGLHVKIAQRQQPGADGASIPRFRDQVQRVLTRKQEVLNELSSLQADNNKALNDIRERQLRITQLQSATNMLRSDDFRDFSNQVRAKKAATEGMRTRLAELRAEWGALTFTKATLQEQYNALDAAIGDLESKLGLQGYSRTVEALSKLTHEKDAIEEVKGKTLEELSRVVQEFTLAIREGRTRLAPLINELRAVRQTAAEVDQEWSEKKTQYEYQESLLTEDIQKIDEDVTRLKDETRVNESFYHRVRSQDVLLTAQVRRAEEERTFRNDRAASLDPQHKTYAEYLVDVTRTLEARTKEMQGKRRGLEETHDTSVQQVEWFGALRTLLQAKLKTIQAESPPTGAGVRGHTIDDDIQQVMGRAGGADMLVLNTG